MKKRNYLVTLLILVVSLANVNAETYFYAEDRIISVKGEDITYTATGLLNSIRYEFPVIEGESYDYNLYLPFGQTLQNKQRLGFTGKELDASGLHHFQARNLDVNLGRWNRIDPQPTEPPYLYVNNNPLTYIDLLGEEEVLANTRMGWTAPTYGTLVYGREGFPLQIRYLDEEGTPSPWITISSGQLGPLQYKTEGMEEYADVPEGFNFPHGVDVQQRLLFFDLPDYISRYSGWSAQVRVRGVDDQGREGPWSLPSEIANKEILTQVTPDEPILELIEPAMQQVTGDPYSGSLQPMDPW